MRATLQTESRLSKAEFHLAWQGAIVRHADLDPNNHVTNSVICSWLDDGRYILFRHVLRPLLAASDILALATITVDFSREVAMFDEPRIGTTILSIGRTSITVGQGIFVGDACVATATSVTVVAGGEPRKALALTDAQRAELAPYLATPASRLV